MSMYLIAAGAFCVGVAVDHVVTRLRNGKRVAVIVDTPYHPFDENMRARIDLAARTWAARDPNPYADRVARPWVESFVRTAMREAHETPTES
jgi:hypothetical protein